MEEVLPSTGTSESKSRHKKYCEAVMRWYAFSLHHILSLIWREAVFCLAWTLSHLKFSAARWFRKLKLNDKCVHAFLILHVNYLTSDTVWDFLQPTTKKICLKFHSMSNSISFSLNFILLSRLWRGSKNLRQNSLCNFYFTSIPDVIGLTTRLLMWIAAKPLNWMTKHSTNET